MAVSAKGRAEKRASTAARLRQPNLSRYYGRDLSAVRPGSFEFRLLLHRGRGLALIELNPAVVSFFWEDSEATLTGGMELRRPIPSKAESLPVGMGHRVACDVRWAGGWYRLWQMRVQPTEIDPAEGILTVELKDDLTLLQRNERDWSYRRTKARKRGWFPHEIARAVARREGLPIGTLARCRHRTRVVKRGASGLDVIREAYGNERKKTGRRFVVRLRDGKLEVIGLKRNLTLYEFKDQIESALLAQEQAVRPATVIEGRGRIRGKGGKGVRYTHQQRAVVTRFGRVVQKKDYGVVGSLAELREKVRRDYAKKVRVKRTATLTVPGVPFLRRGDGIRWVTKEAGWHGSTAELRDRSFIYLRSVRHEVSPDGYTTTMEVVQEDPYFKDSERRDKEARERARRRKK